MTGRRFFDGGGRPPRESPPGPGGRFRMTSGGGKGRDRCMSGGGNWRVFWTSAGGNGRVFCPLAAGDGAAVGREEEEEDPLLAGGTFEEDEGLEPPFCWEDEIGFLALDGAADSFEGCDDFLAVRAASSLLLAAESEAVFGGGRLSSGREGGRDRLSSGREELCGGRFSSGREEEGFELTLVLVLVLVGFGAGGLSDPAEPSLGILPFGAITFGVLVFTKVPLFPPEIFPAFMASYLASLICLSFSESLGSFRIRSLIFFSSK